MREDIRGCSGVDTPSNKPVPGRLNLFDGLGDSEFEFHPTDRLDLTVVVGDSEAARDDVIEIDHRPGDDIRPLRVGERGSV